MLRTEWRSKRILTSESKGAKVGGRPFAVEEQNVDFEDSISGLDFVWFRCLSRAGGSKEMVDIFSSGRC